MIAVMIRIVVSIGQPILTAAVPSLYCRHITGGSVWMCPGTTWSSAPTGTSGLPAELGEFVMQVSAYGKPPGWWITAAP